MFDTLRRVEEIARMNNISTCRLCEKSGLNYSTVASCKSRSGQLSVDSIERLCAAANIPLSVFFMSQEEFQNYINIESKH